MTISILSKSDLSLVYIRDYCLIPDTANHLHPIGICFYLYKYRVYFYVWFGALILSLIAFLGSNLKLYLLFSYLMFVLFQTFIVISKGKDIFRFSAEDSMWFLSPFSPVRRVAIHVLVHPLFSLIIIATILINCLMMILTPSERIESTE